MTRWVGPSRKWVPAFHLIMPTYTYVCGYCGNREDRQAMVVERDAPQQCGFHHENPFLVDPYICEGPMRRVPTSAAIQFKGSGFYVNDYKRKT